jgi:hypothetical protein
MAPALTHVDVRDPDKESALLAHLSIHDPEKNPKSPEADAQQLLETLRSASDAALLGWAASGLAFHCAGTTAACLPGELAGVVADRLRALPSDFGKPMSARTREVASTLLSLFLDLVRCRLEDLALVRDLLLTERPRTPMLLTSILEIISTVGCGGTKANAGGAAFVHACHLLAIVVDGNDDLCQKVRDAGATGIIGTCLLWGTTGGTSADFGAPPPFDILGTEWMSFATAGVRILEVLVTAQDTDRFLISNPALFQPVWTRGSRPVIMVEACVAAMQRSLSKEAGCMFVQPLHLSGLRMLGAMARLSRDQAGRILSHSGLSFGPAVLAIPHVDEEATLCALWYLAELSTYSDLAQHQLKRLHVVPVVEQALHRYRHSRAIQHEGAQVLSACGAESPPVTKAEASATARSGLSRSCAKRAG